MSQFDDDYDSYMVEWPEYLNSIEKRNLRDDGYGSMNKRIKIDNMVRDLSEDDLCKKYFENNKDKDIINRIVGESFPAYEVASRCFDNNHMSIKQKNGLQNVLITYLLKYKKEKELEF